MRNLLSKLWNDDCGAVYATEIVLVATVLVLGLVAGLKAVNLAVNDELSELASAIGHISQSYSYCGTSGQCAHSHGSQYRDAESNFGIDCIRDFDEREENGFRCGDSR